MRLLKEDELQLVAGGIPKDDGPWEPPPPVPPFPAPRPIPQPLPPDCPENRWRFGW